MACIPIPDITLPTLPVGISITPPAFGGIVVPGLCCNLVPPFTVIPPITLPPLVANPAVLVALNATLQGIQTFINGLVPDCPRSA